MPQVSYTTSNENAPAYPLLSQDFAVHPYYSFQGSNALIKDDVLQKKAFLFSADWDTFMSELEYE